MKRSSMNLVQNVQDFETTPKDVASNFKNLIMKRLLRDIHRNQNKLGLQKCYLV